MRNGCQPSVSLASSEKREAKLPKNASAAQVMAACKKESDELLGSGSGFLVALSPEGGAMTSQKFSELVCTKTGGISFFIGGSHGLHHSPKAKSGHSAFLLRFDNAAPAFQGPCC